MKNLKAVLAKPDRDFQPWGIWIWNLKISERELIDQISSLADYGFGGLAIKPVSGMTPEFFSEEFFELFDLVLKKAQKLNISIRLINTFMESAIWDSALLLKRMRAKNLIFEQCSEMKGPCVFRIERADPGCNIVLAIQDGQPEHVQTDVKVLKGKTDGVTCEYKLPSGSFRVMVFKKEFLKSSYGKYIPNILNADVSRVYAEVFECFCEKFSKSIPAVFQGFINEIPDIYQLKKSFPWDDNIVLAFKNKFKKDLLACFPVLFGDNYDLSNMIRMQMYECIHEMIRKNIIKSMDDWTAKTGMTQWILYPEQYAGKELFVKDIAGECNSLQSVSGLQLPSRKPKNYQFKKNIISNIIMNREKSDVLDVVGCDRLCQGGIIQSLKDEFDKSIHYETTHTLINGILFNIDSDFQMKNFYSFSKQSPEWKYIKLFCDYVSRMNAIARGIRWDRPVAILVPWVLSGDVFDNSVEKFMGINELLNVVKKSGAGFNFVNEQMLGRCSLITGGDFLLPKGRYNGKYKMLVIPDVAYLSDQTVSVIAKLLKNGGRVLFIDSVPKTVKKSLKARERKQIRMITLPELEEELGPLSVISYKHDDSSDSDLYCSYGTGNEYELWLLYNPCTENKKHVKLFATPDDKSFYSLNCKDCEICEIKDYQKNEDRCIIPVCVPPLCTQIIISADKNMMHGYFKQIRKKVTSNRKNNFYSIMLKDQWKFRPGSFNALPLAVWNLRLGLSRRSGGFSRYYESYFSVKDIPSSCYLVLRELEMSEIPIEVLFNGTKAEVCKKINEESIDFKHNKEQINTLFTYKNYHFGLRSVLYDIGKNLKKGFNRISARFSGADIFDSGLLKLPPVVIGNFAITKSSNGWVIENHYGITSHDSWTNYGYPFMSGSGIYRQSFEIPAEYKKLILRFSKVSGPVEVSINEKYLGQCCWCPVEFDITDYCESKRNELTVNVINTLDNLLGLNTQLSGLTGEVYLDVY